MGLIRFCKQCLYKAFVGGHWHVAYRGKNDASYILIDNQKGFWNADPFGIEKDGKLYIFTEYYSCKRNLGMIAYSEIKGSFYFDTKIILDKGTHLSYPFLLSYRSHLWLMPENSQDGKLIVYDLTDSWDAPRLYETIFSDVDYVDCTIGLDEDELFLIGYSEQRKALFSCRLNNDFSVREEPRFLDSSHCSRPAGSWLPGLVRPAQNNVRKYGESLVFYQSCFSESGQLVEKEINRLNAGDIRFANSKKRAQKVHTYNETEHFVIIDVFFEKVDLFRWAKMLHRRAHKRGQRN